jgi:hypothetical protein
MGYRSNVGYVIVFKSPDKSVMSGTPETTNPEKAFAEFSHFLEHILGFIKNNDTHGMVSEEFKYMQIDKDKMIISYHAEDIKWYEELSVCPVAYGSSKASQDIRDGQLPTHPHW